MIRKILICAGIIGFASLTPSLKANGNSTTVKDPSVNADPVNPKVLVQELFELRGCLKSPEISMLKVRA